MTKYIKVKFSPGDKVYKKLSKYSVKDYVFIDNEVTIISIKEINKIDGVIYSVQKNPDTYLEEYSENNLFYSKKESFIDLRKEVEMEYEDIIKRVENERDNYLKIIDKNITKEKLNELR